MDNRPLITDQQGSPSPLNTSGQEGSGAYIPAAFLDFIKAENLFHPKDRLLLAVSGGLDSAVLCELCKQAGFSFAIAHCNFQLRDAESEGDELFVKELAGRYGVEFLLKRFETLVYASDKNVSIQVAARELRYTWFQSLLGVPGHGFAYVLTGHHADDNVETVLMNFFKGTGINGLKGILAKHDKIVRPLLFVRRDQLHSFAEDHKLQWREDSSNASDKYSRNYFRHQVIPQISKIFPQAEENLLANVERFREINIIYSNALRQIIDKLITRRDHQVHLPVGKLLKTQALSTVLFELLKEYNFTSHQVPEVQKLLHSDSGKYVQSKTHRVLRNRAWLIISANEDASASPPIIIEEKDSLVKYPGGGLTITAVNGPVQVVANSQVAQLDARNITYPLILRKWKLGDYFYPLGMPKKKKLSRFFIDQKLSLLQKENTWVLESNKKILWVLGLRIDDRFKLIPSTNAAIVVKLRPAE